MTTDAFSTLETESTMVSKHNKSLDNSTQANKFLQQDVPNQNQN